MAWIAIDQTNWEYSTTPEIDDPINSHNYVGRHTDGVRVNGSGSETYVYCRKTVPPYSGYGELNKTYLDYLASIYEGSQYNFSVVKNSQYIGMM